MLTDSPAYRARRPQSAFTLIELLVALSIIALILSILLPALSAGRHAAQDLKCKSNLRTIAASFQLFANGEGGSRGNSEALGPDRFFIEDFQESIYGVDEFWAGGDAERAPLDGIALTMLCPSAPSASLERRAGMPCSAGAIGPKRQISIGFNMRLHRRTQEIDGVPYLRPAVLSPKIMIQSDVPLLLDTDGNAATEADANPYYAAPPILDDKWVDAYENGAHWFPSQRHHNRMNVAFIGGHVLSSPSGRLEPWWRWSFEPEP